MTTKFLQEAYYRKSPEFEEFMDAVTEICEYRKEHPNFFEFAGTRMNTRLENSIARLFNVENVYFDWNATDITINASTYINYVVNAMANPNQIMSEYETVEDANGIRYKSSENKEFFFTASVGIIDVLDFAPGRFASIILHEVGHNFYFERNFVKTFWLMGALNRLHFKIVKMIHKGRASGSVFWRWLFPTDGEKHQDKYGEAIKNRSYTSKIFDRALSSLGVIAYSSFIGALHRVVVAMYRPNAWVRVYEAELFSDNFPLRYGLAVDAAQSENNLRYIGMSPDEIKRYTSSKDSRTHFTKTLEAVAEYTLSFMDPHPMTDARVENTLKYLERELNTNKNLQPVQKRKISKDITTIKKQVKQREREKQELGIYEVLERLNVILFGTKHPEWRENLDNAQYEAVETAEKAFNEFCRAENIDLTVEDFYDSTQIGMLESATLTDSEFAKVNVVPYEQLYQEGVLDFLNGALRSGSKTSKSKKSSFGQIFKDARGAASEINSAAGKINDPELADTLKKVSRDINKTGKALKSKEFNDNISDLNTTADKFSGAVDKLGGEELGKNIDRVQRLADQNAKIAGDVNKAVDGVNSLFDKAKNNYDGIKGKFDEKVKLGRRNMFMLGGVSLIATAVANVAFYDRKSIILASGEYVKRSRGMIALASSSVDPDDEIDIENNRSKIGLIFRYIVEGLMFAFTAMLFSTATAFLASSLWIGIVIAVAIPFIATWKSVNADTSEMAAKLENEISEIRQFTSTPEYKRLSKAQKQSLAKMTKKLVYLQQKLD